MNHWGVKGQGSEIRWRSRLRAYIDDERNKEWEPCQPERLDFYFERISRLSGTLPYGATT